MKTREIVKKEEVIEEVQQEAVEETAEEAIEPPFEQPIKNLFKETLDDKKEVELVEQTPAIDENQIDEAIDEAIEVLEEDNIKEQLPEEVQEVIKEEIPQEIIKQFEELETLDMKPATKQDIHDIKEILANIRHEIADTKTEVTRRETEYINYLKLIFDRLKFLKGRIGKWFVVSSIVILIGGGVTFTTIYHHWENIEPKINAILGVAKIASNVSKVGG